MLTKSAVKTYLFGIGKNRIFKFLKDQNKLVRKSVDNDDFEETKELLKQIELFKNYFLS
ncbi:hypothetical protein [Polaribacter sp. Asnod1-A03]|uniref:hypothetical protein n=1 Tax=Polaribacter sp. Asnod1-A03 TaxID=3160581 RepID=UPI00386B7175